MSGNVGVAVRGTASSAVADSVTVTVSSPMCFTICGALSGKDSEYSGRSCAVQVCERDEYQSLW